MVEFNLRLTSDDRVSIDVSTNCDFDDILGFESLSSTFLVTGDGGETLNNIVYRDGGRVSDT